VSTFITKLDGTGAGPRLAVKDIIDVAGIPTTGGSRALEQIATPAERDASCLAGARAADARIVGKTNLHELAVLPLGTNPWFGTPQNPLDTAGVNAKARELIAPVLGSERAETLIARIGALERIPDMRELRPLLMS